MTEDKQSNSEPKTEPLNAELANLLVGEAIDGLDGKRTKASIWIQGGSVAFVYLILSDPEKLANSYGPLSIKITLAFLLISLTFGFLCLFISEIYAAVLDSKRIEKYFSENAHLLLPKKTDEKKSSWLDELDLKTKTMVESIQAHWSPPINIFLCQCISFFLAVSLLVVIFFVKY